MVGHIINEFTGIVTKIFKNKSKIIITLPKGGKIVANNEGFDIGDEICFDISSHGVVTKIRSKLVADVTLQVGTNHLLETSIREPPEEEFDQYEYELESEDNSIIGGDDGQDECAFDIHRK